MGTRYTSRTYCRRCGEVVKTVTGMCYGEYDGDDRDYIDECDTCKLKDAQEELKRIPQLEAEVKSLWAKLGKAERHKQLLINHIKKEKIT